MLNISNNRTIAKNSIMLYVRTFFIMAIGFYTSRVVLGKLGQEDYAIYNLVGGIVAIIAFLNSAMYGATSRFLTVALGKGDPDYLKKTFDSAIVVHFWMAVAVFVIGETAGLWFVNSKLIIPENRMLAANVVYQTVLLTLLLNIMQVPFVSSIISHEKMSIYAYVDIINFTLKLVIVFIMAAMPYDHLISFSLLMLGVALVVFLIYYVYTFRKFGECRFRGRHEKVICRQLTSFFGFNMIGNFGAIFNMQAINILINRFFDILYNAATGIATTVSNMVNALTGNMLVAFTPPITKSVASDDKERMASLTKLGMVMSLFFFALFGIPVVVETETVMAVWLGKGMVPPMSEVFCRLIIAGMLFETIRRIAIISIHACGRLKTISLCIGTVLTVNPFIVWLVFRHYPYAPMAYVCTIAANALLAAVSIFMIKRYFKWFNPWFLLWIVAKMLVVIAVTLVTTFWISTLLPPSLWRILLSAVCSTVMLSVLTYIFCMTKANRRMVVDYIAGKIKFVPKKGIR